MDAQYELARDTVIVNRLTQGQSVNVPYIKKTLKTYLTQTNWPVDNNYEDKGNDKQKELYLNEYWTACSDRLRLDILEEVDRKQEWLYGAPLMGAKSRLKCQHQMRIFLPPKEEWPE